MPSSSSLPWPPTPSSLLSTICLASLAVLLSIASQVVAESQDFAKCNFTSYPATGCFDKSTKCVESSGLCECTESHPIHLKGRCFPHRDINELCLSTQLCKRINAKCVDGTGEEVTVDGKDEQYYYSHNILPGSCRCDSKHFFSQANRKCQERILESKCFFTTDCFLKNHALCENGKCQCKSGFYNDFINDECVIKPNLANTLCLYGYNWDKEAQKCRPATFQGESGISALFWPAVAFFLVIFLLRLLKEGMKRDCDRAHERRVRRRGPGSRVLRPRAYPSGLPAVGSTPPAGVARSSTEVIVLMPSGLPPPYSPQPPDVPMTGVTISEAPPSYEEATRNDIAMSSAK